MPGQAAIESEGDDARAEVSLWQAVNWVSFGDFDSRPPREEDEPRLEMAKWKLYEALRDGKLASRGVPIDFRGRRSPGLELSQNVWRWRHVRWEENEADDYADCFTGITVRKSEIETLWPHSVLNLQKTELKEATLPQLDVAIAEVYDAAKAEGKRGPNLSKVTPLVLEVLKAMGVTSTWKDIGKRVRLPVHAQRRHPPGRTVASEKRHRE